MHTEGAGIYALGWVDIDLESEAYQEYLKYMYEVGATDAEINNYALTGWIAGSAFCQGLERVPADADLTLEAFINAVETAPIKNPFGGEVDFSDGKRMGTTQMNLSRMDDTVPAGWVSIIPITSIDEILAK